MSNVKIEPLGNHHDREGFDCEVEALNHYFKNTALQHHKRDISKTHVLTFKEGAGPIIAYTTLSVCDVDFSQERETPILKKLPNTAPAIRLCRLAVDKKHKRQGAGKHMIGFTLTKALEVSESLGCSGIVVDAKDDTAKEYYENFGFITFTSQPLKLFLPMKTIKKLTNKP